MLDGAAARMTGSTSESGAIFDTVADLIFTAVSIVKLMPLIQLPGWLWIWAAIIAIIKTGNIVRGLICKKKPVSLHTVPNKITGFMLFLLPFTMRIVEVEFAAAAVCAAATFAAIQEWYYIAVGHEMV